MAYEIEDEVDWSDSPLGPPSPEANRAAENLNGTQPAVEKPSDDPGLFVSENVDRYEIPPGLPLASTYDVNKAQQHIPSRAQRARIGIHLNRRQPSKDDYINFALYQANQKAYEATLFKNFVAHALHPDRFSEMSMSQPETCADVVPYLQSVVRNVKGIADKMVWNAHSRAVHLLANDGKDGSPFLDLRQINQHMFSDFRHDNPVSVVNRMNESWHRAFPEPAMVRMSTKQYPIGSNSSPLEEIDEIANRVFNDTSFTSALPSGRGINPMRKNKGKGRGLPGAIPREQPLVLSRGNWLAFPQPETIFASPSPPVLPIYHQDISEDVDGLQNIDEPQIIQDLRSIQDYNDNQFGELRSSSSAQHHSTASSTRLEDLFDRYGQDALNSDHSGTPARSEDDLIEKVPSWRMRLINNHKRRLTERWGDPQQTIRRVMPGIRQVIEHAFERGLRPMGDDLESKITIIEAREQRKNAPSPSITSTHAQQQIQESPSAASSTLSQKKASIAAKMEKQRTDAPRKRQKTSTTAPCAANKMKATKMQSVSGSKRQKATKPLKQLSESEGLPSPHSSGSSTLAAHHTIPTTAYIQPKSLDEKPAWLCGIKHAMGYYYNAGDRTSCPGCFVNIKDSKKSRFLDFYMPPSTHSFQPAPDMIYTPSKPGKKPRRSKTRSHNGIAKDAYWAAIDAGATAREARQAGVAAVEAHLRPPPPKEPTPQPTPEPEPDLGPHPSGSKAMEHGQDIPECAYFEKQDRHEQYAWRCDINHALGRYYLAGDKRSCPGCGSNRYGVGKQSDMDFYMPLGVVVRQEASELSLWKPRKPYKLRNPGSKANDKPTQATHNQICSKKYHEAIDAGQEHEEAKCIAIEALDAELDAKQEAKQRQEQSESSEDEGEASSSGGERNSDKKDSANTGQKGNTFHRRGSRGESTPSSVPQKRSAEEVSESDLEDDEDDGTFEAAIYEAMGQNLVEYPASDDDDETSGSDSE
ncbi:hypothetical protein HBH98_071750 [Parastagonospora nodorum]|nr:hypothetical protein HBH53_020230 [Parastagonospora nodorum]KAH4000279.1 hypothetical protein HBI10_107120 [Parastagonospora nodorum]KAH4022398.1 hypothetical protein HBI13_102070 [Parastagonospora nodorum]KAH4178691.1 hypothetical protein HBH43_027370 [Parastagonospora nodorum]KAH4348737.1 hypothetical protein HBH98_071750 [Parastagonospora nodorum]